MSQAGQVVVGELIPLTLQVVDGQAGLRVSCNVVDDLGKSIALVNLQDYGGGLYVDKSVQMPDARFVVAQYSVEGDTYEVVSERFDSVPKTVEPEKFITGIVEGSKMNNDFIIGMVTNEKNP